MSAAMIRAALVALALAATPALAVEPAEMLDDPALEARARDISAGLRCPVCRNESIDESNAGVAADLRRLVRERLEAGDSDAEVIDHIVARYGEYVLLTPRAEGANLALWLAGPALLLAALAAGGLYIRNRARAPAGPAPLSDEEQARLREILRR